jgi:hypothetical protein
MYGADCAEGNSGREQKYSNGSTNEMGQDSIRWRIV